MSYMSGVMMCRSTGLTMNNYTIFGELVAVAFIMYEFTFKKIVNK
jgi:hypothetical protein